MVVKAVLHNIAILMTKRSARKIVAHKYLIILKYCTFSKRTAHQGKRWHMCFVAHPHMSMLTSKRYEWVNNKRSIVEKLTYYIWDHFCEKGPNACFIKISFIYFLYSSSLKCPLYTASYALSRYLSLSCKALNY